MEMKSKNYLRELAKILRSNPSLTLSEAVHQVSQYDWQAYEKLVSQIATNLHIKTYLSAPMCLIEIDEWETKHSRQELIEAIDNT